MSVGTQSNRYSILEHFLSDNLYFLINLSPQVFLLMNFNVYCHNERVHRMLYIWQNIVWTLLEVGIDLLRDNCKRKNV